MQELEINPTKLKTAKIMCLDDTLFYTRYFFKHQYKRKFVVNSHHNLVCAVLDKVYQGQLVKVIINIAPRYSKTELAVKNFISKGLALNPASKYIHLSYSDDLALDNSEGIKDIVNLPEYQLLFPDVKIKQGSDSKKKWYTSKGGGVYATSTAGQVTGFGAGRVDDEEEDLNNFFDAIEAAQDFNGALVVDDPIKPEDAFSDLRRERINERWTTTIQNRVNSRRTPMIVMGQRTHPRDLCGFLMETDGHTTDINEAINNSHLWYVMSIPAIQEDDNGIEFALWPFKHTLPELKRMERADPHMFGTQYMQNPQPKEGLMYSDFSQYQIIPASRMQRKKAYIDTADEGFDYLCAITYVESEVAMYVTDVYYTQDPMPTTEPATALMLTKHSVEYAEIESNNGGKGFSRNVETQCRLLGNLKTVIHWFHQSNNKLQRINTNSASATNMILMPVNWEYMWPKFHKAVTQYSKVGKNAHDDACFIAGTQIATIYGLKNIEHIQIGDKVITPFGIRKVIAAVCTGNKKVITNIGLTGTPDHKIFSKNRFDSLTSMLENNVSLLSINKLIIWRYKKLLCSMELNTDLWGRENIILANQRIIKDGKVLKDYMLRFGSFITNKQYQNAFVFTIKTIILLTTILEIWSVYQFGNIFRTTPKRICKILNTLSKTKLHWIKQGLKQVNGIKANRVDYGINIMRKIASGLKRILPVKTVTKILNLFLPIPSFAAINVVKPIEENTTEYNIPANVNFAEMNLQPKKSNHLALSAFTVPEVAPIEHVQKVYNITVEKDGVYYANGVLVSNCDCLTGMVENFGKGGGAKFSFGKKH